MSNSFSLRFPLLQFCHIWKCYLNREQCVWFVAGVCIHIRTSRLYLRSSFFHVFQSHIFFFIKYSNLVYGVEKYKMAHICTFVHFNKGVLFFWWIERKNIEFYMCFSCAFSSFTFLSTNNLVRGHINWSEKTKERNNNTSEWLECVYFSQNATTLNTFMNILHGMCGTLVRARATISKNTG